MTRPRRAYGNVVSFGPRPDRRRGSQFAVASRPHAILRAIGENGVAIVAATAFGAVLALAWLNGPPTAARQMSASIDAIPRSQVAVVDGDTIRVHGKLTRLVGFNAPETFEPRCGSELRLGGQATARLRDLVATRLLEFVAVACACRPGTEGTPQCNYGRACGILRADGRNVGDILIAEGLAVPFVCRGTGCPPTPRPWCSG
jgi:micrococcal nuclease